MIDSNEAAEARLPKAVLTYEETKKFLEATPPSTPKNLRDRTILELMYSTALRIPEIQRLNLSDIDIQNRKIRIKDDRRAEVWFVPVGETAIAWIERYLAEARSCFRPAPDQKALFLTSWGERLCTSAVARRVLAAQKRAGIERKGTAYFLRRAAVNHMMQAGVNSFLASAIDTKNSSKENAQ